MGQYYYVVNVTKRQFLHPHKFGDGLKLMEFGASGGGTMLGLAILLANGNGRGGGGLGSDANVVGSWAGDQIVIAGDYADPGPFAFTGEKSLYRLCEDGSGEFEDISKRVLRAMCDDKYTAEDLKEQRYFLDGPFATIYDFAMSDDSAD